jgi:hypothetical protein
MNEHNQPNNTRRKAMRKHHGAGLKATKKRKHEREIADILKAIEAAIEALAAKGLICDSGRRRNGQICWELTELGKQMGPNELEAAVKATKQ